MKKLLPLLLLFFSLLSIQAQAQISAATARRIIAVPSLPSICTVGDVAFLISPPQPYFCDATNHWSAVWATVSGAVVSFNTRVGVVTLNSSDVITALGFTPQSAAAVATVAQGGTGTPFLTAHTVIVGDGALSVNLVGVGPSGTFLAGLSGNDPLFRAIVLADLPLIPLSSQITGTLPPANGGTGQATFVPYGVITGGTTGTGPFQQVSGLGTPGQVLTSNGAGALPTFQNGGGGGGGGSATNAVGIINSNDPSIGLVGDARQCDDASVSGSTVTSLGHCGFAPGDVGKVINLNGAAPLVAISNAPNVFITNGTTALSGINVPGGSTNTYFLDQLAPGMQIKIGAQTAIIASVQSQTAATLAAPWPATTCNPCGGLSTTGVWKAVITSFSSSTQVGIQPAAPVATSATPIGAWVYTDNTLAWNRLNAYLIANDSTTANFVLGATGVFRKNDDSWGMQNVLRAEIRFNGANLIGGYGYGQTNALNVIPRPATGFQVSYNNLGADGGIVVTTSQAPGTGFLAGSHVLPGDTLTFTDGLAVGLTRTVVVVSSDNTLVVNAPIPFNSSSHYTQTALGFIASGAVQEGQYTTTGVTNGLLKSTYNYINTVEAGSTKIVLQNPTFLVNGTAEWLRYKVGDPIFIGGFDQQGGGVPPNFRYFEYNTIVATNVNGTITLLTPTKYKYDAAWNWMPYDTTGAAFPMGALVMPLNKPAGVNLGRVENIKLVIRDLIGGPTEPGTAAPGSSRSNIDIEGSLQLELYNVQTISGAFGDNKNVSIYDSYFGNWNIDSIGGIEIDKGLESFNIDSTSKASRGRYQSLGQGTGALKVSLKNSVFDTINITPRTLEVLDNDLLNPVTIGGGWAVEKVRVEGNRYFLDNGRRTVYPIVLNATTALTTVSGSFASGIPGTFRPTDVGRTVIGVNIPSATTIVSVSADGVACVVNQAATGSITETITIQGNVRLLYNATGLYNAVAIGTGSAGSPAAPTQQTMNVAEALQGVTLAPPTLSHFTIEPGTVLTKQPLTGTGTITSMSGVNVVGASTLFTTELTVGDIFIFNGQTAKVATITDNTHIALTLALPVAPAVSGQTYQHDRPAAYLNRGTVTNLNKALTSSTHTVTGITYSGGQTSTVTLNSADANLVAGIELQITDGSGNVFVTAVRDNNPGSLTTLTCFPIIYLSGSPLTTGAVTYTFQYATTQIFANFKVAPVAGDIFSYNVLQKAYLAHNSLMVDGVEQPMSMLSTIIGNSGALEPPTAEYFYGQEDNNGFEQTTVIYNLPKIGDTNEGVPLDIKGYISSIDVIITKPYTGGGTFTLRLTDSINGIQDTNYSYLLVNCNLPGVRSVTPWTSNGALSGDTLAPQQYRYVDTLFLLGSGNTNPLPSEQYQGFAVVRYIKKVL